MIDEYSRLSLEEKASAVNIYRGLRVPSTLRNSHQRSATATLARDGSPLLTPQPQSGQDVSCPLYAPNIRVIARARSIFNGASQQA